MSRFVVPDRVVSPSTCFGVRYSRGNFLPAFRLCDHCGNSLEPAMQKLEMLAAVQRNLGLDRVIAA